VDAAGALSMRAQTAKVGKMHGADLCSESCATAAASAAAVASLLSASRVALQGWRTQRARGFYAFRVCRRAASFSFISAGRPINRGPPPSCRQLRWLP